MLDLTDLLLLLIFAIGAVVQTTTGFAFGLVVMSGAAVFNLASIEMMAFVVSVLSFVNSSTGLIGGLWRHALWRQIGIFFIASGPAIGLGVWLLDYLGNSAIAGLQLLLGATLIAACALSWFKPAANQPLASNQAYLWCGAIAGVLGGLFSTSGPPISYLMYRQPLSLATIRATLLTIFWLTCIIRVGITGASGLITHDMWLWSAIGFPVVFITTLLIKRFPLPFAPERVRQLAMILLVLSGVSLLAKGSIGVLGY
ncbi:sulfite exporter TauE/SafE family protein [Maribrevibacterium harenarium]|uniref:Probable membrane transporter protein n=1 Tax=Maribrevibacterium harenarium TaxID=2589817 RepID=A0A501X4A3_9GAMM|nr:sulfite exporter TauE/SafE family protein [Maribrevibacterium harenarium]TPE55370.1 sulfite exporter TauE/SafE family protein [Maribrevibacterium harenarium]